MVYDSNRNRIVLFGGESENEYNDTWEWDGTNWNQCYSTVTPSARAAHAMAYDSARQRTVLFGGKGVGQDNDTWEWDGTNWTQKFPTNSPIARDGHRMAYDVARSKTILFGGFSDVNDTTIGDTWEWDGTNWTQLFPINIPPSRSFFTMAYDSGRQRIVVFSGGGGTRLAPLDLSDTWEWDGTNWIEINPTNRPSSRYNHSMAYDPVRQKTVLYGGVSEDSPYSYNIPVVWEWDGANWEYKIPITKPGARLNGAVLSYDGINQRVIMWR